MNHSPLNPELKRIPRPEAGPAMDWRDFGAESSEAERTEQGTETARKAVQEIRDAGSGKIQADSSEAARITSEMLQSDKALSEEQIKLLVTETLQGNLDPSNPAEVVEILNTYQRHKMEHPENLH